MSNIRLHGVRVQPYPLGARSEHFGLVATDLFHRGRDRDR
jgi:hypothetical protein